MFNQTQILLLFIIIHSFKGLIIIIIHIIFGSFTWLIIHSLFIIHYYSFVSLFRLSGHVHARKQGRCSHKLYKISGEFLHDYSNVSKLFIANNAV